MIETFVNVLSKDSLHSFTGFTLTVVAMMIGWYLYNENNKWP